MLDKYNSEKSSIENKSTSDKLPAVSLTTFGAMQRGGGMVGVPAGKIAEQVEALKRERDGKNG